MKKKFFGSLGFLAATSLVTNAAVVSIDFNFGSPTHVGLAGAPDTEGASAIWNGTNGTPINAALDSAGTVTPVGLTIDSRGSFNNLSDQELASGQVDLFSDYLSSRANSNSNDLRTGNFSGLIPGNSYDLYFYGQGDNFTATSDNGGQNVGIRIGSDVRHTSYDGTSGGDGQLVEDIEFVVFRSIVADSTGTIGFEHFNPGTGLHATDMSFFDSSTGLADVDGNPSRFHALNGVQIVGTFVIPEPSSLSLLGMAGLLLFKRRRS